MQQLLIFESVCVKKFGVQFCNGTVIYAEISPQTESVTVAGGGGKWMNT